MNFSLKKIESALAFIVPAGLAQSCVQ